MKKVTLKKATTDEMPIVLNMGNLYRYDLSEFMLWTIESDGMHRCYGLEDYWHNEHIPFIIYVDKELAGFVLLSVNEAEKIYEVGEFFVLRKFRRLGVARTVALKLFEDFKGQWVMKQLVANKPAIAFWKKIVADYSPNNFDAGYEKDAEFGELFVIRFFN